MKMAMATLIGTFFFEKKIVRNRVEKTSNGRKFNREDSSDLDENLTELIAAAQAFIF